MTHKVAMSGWSDLLASIGAEPVTWIPEVRPAAPVQAWMIQLQTTGVDVLIDDVQVDKSTGLYVYKGKQVLIYIKDTQQTSYLLLHERDRSKRFHYMDCETIEKMKANRRYQRYVAIARTDGAFPVFTREEDGTTSEIEAPLGVCKNCLGAINYKSYKDSSPREKASIWNSFSIEEFFLENSSRISTLPADSCSVMPSEYTSDWDTISHQIRTVNRWRCSQCRVDLAGARSCLHVHHVDGVRNNNSLSNLRVLCALCHADQPMHEHMWVDPGVRATIVRLRNEQGKR